MTDDEQMERFGEAVERKKEESKAASEAPHDEHPGDEAPAKTADEPQDEDDQRTKSTGHGQKTADKWNQ